MMSIVLSIGVPQAVRSQETEPVPSARLVVLPFTNSTGQGEYADASAGLQLLLTAYLSQYRDLLVVEREQLEEAIRELGFSLQGYTQDPHAWQTIGNFYNANRLVSGGFMLVNEQWNIHAHVFDVETTRLITSQEVSGPADELTRLAKDLAARIVGGLQISTALRQDRPLDAEPERSTHFLQGLGYSSVNLYDHAIAEFMETLDLRPDDPDARWWLAKSYLAAGEADHARVEFERFKADFPLHPLTREIEALLSPADPRAADADPPPLPEGQRDAP